MTRPSDPATEIDRTALVDLTETLVGIPSENPPGEEEAVVAALADRLAESHVDFDIAVDEVLPGRSNVVARAGDPSRGSVLLTGHVDVVPADAVDWTDNPYEPRRVEGRIVGRGAADMKGAIAAMIIGAEVYLASADTPGEVVLAFVVDEEHRGAGTQALVEEGLDVDAAVVGEPTQLDVCIAQKGVARYRLSIDGESAHSGTPDEGEDAIHAAGRVLSALETFDERLRAETTSDLLNPETLTVTEMEGGSAPNVVAGHAKLVVDWRFLPDRGVDADPFDDTVDEVIEGPDLGGDIAVDRERTVFARAGSVPADIDVVDTLRAAAADVGVDSDLVGFNGGTDARFLLHDADVPTVLLGPGDPAEAHAVDESLPIESLHDAARIYRRVLERSFA